MVKKKFGDVFKTSKKKVKPISGRPKKLSTIKETPEMSTLRSFGIYINDAKKAEVLFAVICQEAKKSGESISIVAKRYRENIKKNKNL